MTYRHYRIPGGYQRPNKQISRAGRYGLPSNYDSIPPDALPATIPLNQTDPKDPGGNGGEGIVFWDNSTPWDGQTLWS